MLDNPIPWPDGHRCAVSITWDVDADSGLNYYNQDKADNLVASQSQTRYDPLIAVPRLVKLLRKGDSARAVRLTREHTEGTEHILAGLFPVPPGRRPSDVQMADV